MRVHNFADDLAWSRAQAEDPMWERFYRSGFPEFESMEFVDDLTLQKRGVDRIVTLRGGKTVLVDEKPRKDVWPDVLLEIWSNHEKRIRGWLVKDQYCDYLAYAWLPTHQGLVLPFQLLRMAWRANGREWARTCKRVVAPNPGYTTVSYAIPVEVLLDAVQKAMVVNYEPPKPDGRLALFGFDAGL